MKLIHYFIIIIAFIILCLLSISLGAISFSWESLLDGNNSAQINLLLISRIPRTIALVLAGWSMAVSGLIMQMLSQNKFTEPGTTGTIESATLGLVLAGFIFPSYPIIVKISFSCIISILGTVIFIVIINRTPLKSPILVPLIGIMLGGVINSCSTFIAYKYDIMQSLISWSTADFSIILRNRYEMLWGAFFATIVAYFFANHITVTGLGKDFASNLGINYKKILILGVFIVSISTAIIVSTVGAIPFVGLIVPNIVSILVGDNFYKTTPLTGALGASFVLACDVISRTIVSPFEIPLGSVISVIGEIAFLFIIVHGANKLEK
ncbi:ABC transporter permease [Citrobacter amalonaticus]